MIMSQHLLLIMTRLIQLQLLRIVKVVLFVMLLATFADIYVRKLNCSKHELKEEIVLCLMALIKDTPEVCSKCAVSVLALNSGH